MEFRKLRHAVALARCLNFTRAAHDLHITQSALSRSIQSLEADCGLRLFDRDRGAVMPTQAGREFIRHAKALLRSEAALRDVIGEAARGEGGHITLGVTPLVAHALLPPVLAARVDRPNFRADVRITSSLRLLPMVMQETIDLGIGMEGLHLGRADFSKVELARLSMCLIVRMGHPLTRLRSVTEEDVGGYPLVRATPSTSEDGLTIHAGMIRSKPPAVTIEDYHVLSEIVANSDAVWMTAPVAAQAGLASGRLAKIPIAWLERATMSLVAYHLARRTLSPLAEALLEQFRAASAELAC